VFPSAIAENKNCYSQPQLNFVVLRCEINEKVTEYYVVFSYKDFELFMAEVKLSNLIGKVKAGDSRIEPERLLHLRKNHMIDGTIVEKKPSTSEILERLENRRYGTRGSTIAKKNQNQFHDLSLEGGTPDDSRILFIFPMEKKAMVCWMYVLQYL
jgi:hypothetical protein